MEEGLVGRKASLKEDKRVVIRFNEREYCVHNNNIVSVHLVFILLTLLLILLSEKLNHAGAWKDTLKVTSLMVFPMKFTMLCMAHWLCLTFVE